MKWWILWCFIALLVGIYFCKQCPAHKRCPRYLETHILGETL